MSSTTDSTTLVCLFHHHDKAQAAINDLEKAGIPRSSLTTINGKNDPDSGFSTLESLGVPARDLRHLQDGLGDGGTVIAVSAPSGHVNVVERIFAEHSATKIDETDGRSSQLAEAAPLAGAAAGAAALGRAPVAGETAIPVVEEELAVGKRTVDQGGVRVFRHVVEVPVEQSVNLREEHVVVERKAVNRPATGAELNNQADRSIELTETAEEAVVGKNARVVEELVIGKQAEERTEHIRDTVRRTEVEVEELPATDTLRGPNTSR